MFRVYQLSVRYSFCQGDWKMIFAPSPTYKKFKDLSYYRVDTSLYSLFPFNFNNVDEKNNVFNLLVEHNILIRDQSKQQQLENCLRISIGSEEEIAQLKQLLETL